MSRRRGQLTRRGELAVLGAVMVALALVVEAAHASLWLRSWGLAGAAMFGLLIVAGIVTTLLLAAGRAAGRGATLVRIRWHRWRFSREAYQDALDRLRARNAITLPDGADEISPQAVARIQAAVADELAQRRHGPGAV